eukprot:CAMPEP_0194287386 /NCGR_PEP_ID=MMETSP0169-20130528/34652_1 /TAXON_ID=218684 /ORGANISM="Corethron pennatum, Strain L29A3" /LENGTH=125 /DNA_ID=CAMNT_0039034071 /DNA_START=163 /DNA_END=537 /DNA_ORIENTATION=-
MTGAESSSTFDVHITAVGLRGIILASSFSSSSSAFPGDTSSTMALATFYRTDACNASSRSCSTCASSPLTTSGALKNSTNSDNSRNYARYAAVWSNRKRQREKRWEGGGEGASVKFQAGPARADG